MFSLQDDCPKDNIRNQEENKIINRNSVFEFLFFDKICIFIYYIDVRIIFGIILIFFYRYQQNKK